MFSEMYWAVFAAGISVVVVYEVWGFAFGYYMHKRELRKMHEYQEKMKAQGIDPMAMMAGMMPGGVPFGGPLPTTSGNSTNVQANNESGVGQYL